MDLVNQTKESLIAKLNSLPASEKASILKSNEMKALYAQIPKLKPEERASFGAEVNKLKLELEELIAESPTDQKNLEKPFDVSAPFGVNAKAPELFPTTGGSIHPINQEIDKLINIFYGMGFEAFESRQIDDGWHMFTSLNFPEDHPARDDYDTFITEEGLIAPAHTSTMQSRILSLRKNDLEEGRPIAAVVPDRVFRNEDLDARHEHTFHQIEGIYVDKNINVGNLIATLKTLLSSYYQKDVETRINPFYFPFTEPSFEFALSCPFCDKKGCSICSQSGWIELLGCGMIHPNVLEMAGVDSKKYSGFAFGCGIERLIMMKYGIEDIRHFFSAKLKFLRQF
ncbi:MAG: phenylalanine--tRNA ligase subunit alpha [Candidatus Saccharimonadales bacterium]